MTQSIEGVRNVEGGRREVVRILRDVASSAGGDFKFLLKVAERESSLRADARAPTSSASGLFQFIEQTWLEAVKKHGGKAGLEAEAAEITRTESGYAVSSPERRAEILNKRFDPRAAATIAVETFRDTAEALSAKIGRKPDNGELYLAHFLGASGAARMIEADGAASAADVAPSAARANKSLFYENGAPVSVEAFRREATAAFSRLSSEAQPVSTPISPSQWTPAPVKTRHYAPPMQSPVHSYSDNLLPMSVFREILDLESVRQFSTGENSETDRSEDDA